MSPKTGKTGGEIVIIPERCKGCGFCIEFCPARVLEFSPEFNEKGYYPPRLKPDGVCASCGLCQLLCPEMAIFLREKPYAYNPFE